MAKAQRLYAAVYTDENLDEAWHHVRRGSEAAGVDGVTLSQFQRRIFTNLKALQRELAERRYHPQPVKRLLVPKEDGRARPIGVLTVRDRVAQRAVLQVIEPLFEASFEDHSFGYRPGRSAQMALECVERGLREGRPWIVHLDIREFFDSVDIDRLYALLRRRIRDRELLRLIRLWLEAQTLTVETPRGRGWLRRLYLRPRPRPRRRGLLQGGILSPLLANVYLDAFDKQALQHGLRPVRYADDILLLCPSRAEAQRALREARKLLERLGLALHPEKTEIVHAREGFKFLGRTLLLQRWSERDRDQDRDAEALEPEEGAGDGHGDDVTADDTPEPAFGEEGEGLSIDGLEAETRADKEGFS